MELDFLEGHPVGVDIDVGHVSYIIIIILSMLGLYIFVQRYFIHGFMLGSMKR